VEGEKRIDKIEIGDYVWSYDTKTDKKVATEVTNILVSKTDVLVYVILSDGKEIKTTLYHPFYVKMEKQENGKQHLILNQVIYF